MRTSGGGGISDFGHLRTLGPGGTGGGGQGVKNGRKFADVLYVIVMTSSLLTLKIGIFQFFPKMAQNCP